MPAKHQILVSHNGTIEREEPTGGRWLKRGTETSPRYFVLAGYACSKMSDDHQEGAVVYVERPSFLFHSENDPK